MERLSSVVHLHNTTTGAPEERLLVYDRYDPEPQELVNLLQAQDVPAQQIVIEALVIEVNTSKLQDLGVEWRGSQGSGQASFERSSIFSGKRLVLSFSLETAFMRFYERSLR